MMIGDVIHSSGSFEYKKSRGSAYKFNANGSLLADKSRGIAYITYDLNNNPRQIYFTNGSVTRYVYSAMGQKLRVIHYTAKPNITRTWGVKPAELTASQILQTDSTDYLMNGKLMMKNGRIDRYLFDGGYAKATPSGSSSDSFAFYYYNQDHLGNVREVVDGSGNILQVTNYYPSGTPYFDASSTKNANMQPYKYNGKELDRMHGLDTYDYGARQYDPILMRWDRMDPLCEKNPDVTPYHFCHNNPVNRVDPDGRDDYFNSSGAFMYSTSKGSNVYVNNVLITDVSLTNGASRQAVANVMGHYAHQVGISFYAKGGRPVGESPRGTLSLADFGKSSDATLAHTKGDNIQINKHDSKIGSALHDKYNIMSTLEHEKFHKEADHGKENNLSASAHAGVYAKQMRSSIFLKTTGDYQDGIISSFIKFLESAIKEGVNEGRINSLIEDVNNSLQKSGSQIYYERNGGDSYRIFRR